MYNTEINYSKLEGLDKFTGTLLDQVEVLARALSKDEILEYIGVKFEELGDLETRYFNTAFKRGRMKAKNEAVNALFNEMKGGRQAHNAAMSYLTRFADEFKEGGGAIVGNGFSLNVVLDD